MAEKNRQNSTHHPGMISRRDFVKIAGAGAVGLWAGCGHSQTDSADIALVNGRIIDGTGGNVVENGTVLIDDRHILAVGLGSKVKVPANTTIMDVQDKTILPGFINSHVHLGYNRETLKAWLQGGVTTVRDLGAFSSFIADLLKKRDALNKVAECSHLSCSGAFINAPGGYPVAFWGGYALAVKSPDDARKAVNQLLDMGVDVIKTAFESGYTFRQSGWPLLKPDEALELVAAAHERGKPVIAHVTSARDLSLALDAGVDEIAHMVVDTLPDELISRMIQANTRWVPTLELWQGVSQKYPVDFSDMAIRNLGRFVQAGGQVAMGTDYAGSPNVTFDLGMPVREIKLMQKTGMTPMQIIVASTKNGALACNMEDKRGTIEKGKLADILVVDGNPLTDIQALAKVHLVLRRGKPVIKDGMQS